MGLIMYERYFAYGSKKKKTRTHPGKYHVELRATAHIVWPVLLGLVIFIRISVVTLQI